MTEAQRLALEYLSGLMEGTANMIGHAIVGKVKGGGSNYIAVGAGVAVSLRKLGYVSRVRELNAWQITTAGRKALDLYGIRAQMHQGCHSLQFP